MNAETSWLLLTGASSGLGRQMALRLSSTRRLILNGRDAGRLLGTLQACHEPGSHRIWQCDLADVDRVGERLAQFMMDAQLRVSAFVHSAALLKILPLRSLTLEHVKAIMSVNLLSAMEITKILTKRKVNDGQLRSVVFLSSIASQFGAKGFAAYCATKGGLDALMRALAVELAPEVRVNSVLPGGIRSEMTQQIFEDEAVRERLEREYPLGMGEPDDVVNMVEFLLSDKARWITGQQLVVDGGRTANITA